MASSNGNLIITNQTFLTAYDELKISAINQAKNTRTVSWDQLCQIFEKIKVNLCDVPTDTVSQVHIYRSKIFVMYEMHYAYATQKMKCLALKKRK